MARFDVYRNPEGTGYLLDVQANVLSHLNTRLVIPLMPSQEAPKPAKTLNPCLSIGGDEVVLVTQFLAAVPITILSEPVTKLDHHHDEIVDAIDFLLQGF
jgi:toxin CcdB